MHETLNAHGDRARPTDGGHGMDIASQRADELDLMAIAHIEALVAGALGDRDVLALDVGCGHGGQAARMAKFGAKVLAIDVGDCAEKVAVAMRRQGVGAAAWAFRRMGIEQVGTLGVRADVIVCQRMIHYLRHAHAREALRALRSAAAQRCTLYLSASGMQTELVDGYAGQGARVDERFATLRVDRSLKHGIAQPVCLYREDELAALVRGAGWTVETVFRSAFGNVKLVASLG